jgi:hypothetical protein
VRDRANKILFVYNLEGIARDPDAEMIRIMPISAATEANMLKYEASHGRRFQGSHLPRLRQCANFRP